MDPRERGRERRNGWRVRGRKRETERVRTINQLSSGNWVCALTRNQICNCLVYRTTHWATLVKAVRYYLTVWKDYGKLEKFLNSKRICYHAPSIKASFTSLLHLPKINPLEILTNKNRTPHPISSIKTREF